MMATDTQFFHAIDPRDQIACHNLFVGNGGITSISFVRAQVPEWSGMRSPYEAFNSEGEKEKIFEGVRGQAFPTAPPRLGALFLFGSADDAAAANERWWQGHRVVLPASILMATRFGTFDASHLNATRDRWESAAYAYWSGQRMPAAQIEVLVEGRIQLQGWEQYARKL